MLQLPEPWFRPADERSQSLRREALAEIGPDHELAGRGLDVVAACSGCDQVVFEVDDGTFAIVHLTWTGRPERGHWPATRRVQSVVALGQVTSDHRH